METINSIADQILDLCDVPPEERDCLRCEIAKAIAQERRRLNEQVQMYMAQFRNQVEAELLPPEDCYRHCGGQHG